MNNNYDSNMYLMTSYLNDFENQIDYVTNQIQEKVFDDAQSPLRNIQVGDNLSGKTLYMSFPRDSYENITNTNRIEIITINNNVRIAYMHETSNNRRVIYLRYNNRSTYLYAKSDSNNDPYLNYTKFKLPNDFGIVTSIDSSDMFYQYIKIYDNEYIIPNYEKHVWVDNEILSMQKIENIEHGIKNIGYYYYKPRGWITTKDWLPTSSLNNYNYNVNIRNISYSDLNRWLTDLNLINFDDLDIMTIWNSVISEIDWNKQNYTEWEEY